jgi:hypothetical protein
MSDPRAAQADLTFALPGEEWWYFSGALYAHERDVRVTPRIQPGVAAATVSVAEELPEQSAVAPLGEMAFIPGDGRTQVYVTFAAHTAEVAAFWSTVRTFLEKLARQARSHRQTAGRGMTPDEAIEWYYRSKAAGRKITLKQVAGLTGMNYEALKKHKQRYDAAGKWGSKKQ